MEEFEPASEVSLAVVYVDEHLLELEAIVKRGYWGGRAQAYTTAPQIADFTTALERFVDQTVPEAELVAGDDTGVGLIGLRFYRVDRSGHICCHIRLAGGKVCSDHRPGEIPQLSVEAKVEAWAVSRFAQQLAELAKTQAGQASLSILASP